MTRTFDELVDEACAAPVDTWDFSWLPGRATEDRPSWRYFDRVRGHRESLPHRGPQAQLMVVVLSIGSREQLEDHVDRSAS